MHSRQGLLFRSTAVLIRRRIPVTLATLIFGALLLAAGLAWGAPAIRVNVDGRPVELGSGMTIEGARLLVPIELVTHLGGVADWLEDGRLRLTFPDAVLFLRPGEARGEVNGKPVDIRPALRQTTAGAMMPLQFLADVLSLRIAFDLSRHTLSILQPQARMLAGGQQPTRAARAKIAEPLGKPAAPVAAAFRPVAAAPVVAVPAGEVQPGAAGDAPELLALRAFDRGGQARIDVETDAAVSVEASLLSNPPRVVVDMKGARLAGPVHLDTPGIPAVKGVRAARFDAETVRVVVELRAPLGYRVEPRAGGPGWSIWVNRPIRNVSFEPAADGGYLRIDGPEGMQVTTSLLRAPDRLVVDLADATLLTGAQNLSSATGPVAALRASQFRPDTARVVLDLRRPAGLVLSSERTSAEGEEGDQPDRSAGLTFVVRDALQAVGYRVAMGSEAVVVKASVPLEPTVRVERNPNRLVVDVPGVILAEPLADLGFVDGPVRNLSAAQLDDQTVRVVVDLRRPVRSTPKTADGGRTALIELEAESLEGFFTIVDPGHGGTDAGAFRRIVTEKEVNLDIARRVEALIEDAGGKVVLTRTADADVFLLDRAVVSNQLNPDILVSIHSNSSPSPQATGTETYYAPRPEAPDLSRSERAALTVESRRLATALQESLVKAIGLPDRGVRTAAFLVLRHSRVPTTLVEVGFLSNPNEEKLLADPNFRQKAAEGIYDGIVRYANEKRPPNPRGTGPDRPDVTAKAVFMRPVAAAAGGS